MPSPEPLAGVNVLDFSTAWAGPTCGRLLADYGANVIKVESDRAIDVGRTVGPFPGDPDPNTSGYFIEWNRNKRSIVLDLRAEPDIEVARRLISEADIIVENFSPGVMERFALDYPRVRELKPDLIMLSISGFGATGPERSFVAFGQQIEANSGLMSVTGYEDGEPMKTGISYPDPVAGIAGFAALMTALIHRDATGEGQWIDLSMLEVTVGLLADAVVELSLTGESPRARGNRSPVAAPHGIYRCGTDDRWIAIECRDEEEWEGLAALWPELAADPRFDTRASRLANVRELDAALRAHTASRDAVELAEQLQTAGVPAAAAATIEDLFADEHLKTRRFWVDTDHPKVGCHRGTGVMARLEGTPPRRREPAPLLGAHGGEIRERGFRA